MKTTVLLFLALLLSGSEIIAQKVKDEEVTFKYKRLPSNPVSRTIVSYTPQVVLAYEEEDKRKMEEYEQQTAASNEKYQQDKKTADAKYAKEKQEYKDKPLGEKFVEKAFLDQGAPKQQYVGKDYVQKPFTRQIFDKDLLASVYIKLEGYEKSNNSPLLVSFISHGIEWLPPTTTSSSSTSKSGATQTSYKSTLQYRSPVSIKVETAEGAIILSEAVEKTSEYSLYSTNTSSIHPETVIPTLEQKALEASMKIANQCLNNKCAISIVERQTVLYNVESKKADYSDFQQAYLDAMEGYTLLVESPEEAVKKLQSAIAAWDKALKESNTKDKKARVNEEITIAAIFNLAEAYIMTNEFTKAKLVAAKASALDLSRKETKRMEEIKLLADDLRQRYEANQGS